MKDLEFQIKDEDEICLPNWIGVSKLTLAEIGAIAFIACGQTDAGGYPELWQERMSSLEMAECLKSLKEKRVFKLTQQGKNVSMAFDLDVVAPE